MKPEILHLIEELLEMVTLIPSRDNKLPSACNFWGKFFKIGESGESLDYSLFGMQAPQK
ncbi:hypothetical protein HY17_19420 [Hyphomonas sp. CY54-11-8]|nr:hypothetical protein HY17_19420 [Hyphomonas sp. CY54-11-8]